MVSKLININMIIALLGVFAFTAVDRAQAGSGALSPVEAEGILHMREVEKLAHDAYTTFYSLYRVRMFYGISNSEQRHMDAVKTLITRYGLPDPASSKIGVFNDPNLQII